MNRRSVRIAIVLAVTVAALESSPYLLSPIVNGEPFSRSRIRRELFTTGRALAYDTATATNEEYLAEHILHPYLGYVSVPQASRNRFGLPGADPLMRRSPDTVNVCLMGGSVAMGVQTFSLQRLFDRLGRTDAFRGKKFRACVFALGGYKQPQPLLALSWFRSLGAEYDLILTLDGFNEIVLPYCDNLPFHVFPAFPRHWNLFSRKKMDLRMQRLAMEHLAVEAQREDHRELFERRPWRWSNVALLIWRTLDRRHGSDLADIESRTRDALTTADTDPQSSGPVWALSDTTAFLAEQAAEWARCQRLIAQQAASMGALDFHFLQPNQYVPGSKTLTEEERSIAIAPEPNCYREAVERGYPMLSNETVRLDSEGIRAVDLTRMFRSEQRPVYGDNCCHFDQLGWDLIADAMANAIVRSMGETRIPRNDGTSPGRSPER